MVIVKGFVYCDGQTNTGVGDKSSGLFIPLLNFVMTYGRLVNLRWEISVGHGNEHTNYQRVFWEFLKETFWLRAIHIKVQGISRKDKGCEQKVGEC
jgi:hypothetical protein